MKRFWDHAAAVPDGDGWAIQLDGRPVRLPGEGAALRVSGQALAAAVAAEWEAAGGAKGGEMGWDAVPLTRLAGTAQDRIAADPAPVIDGLARYGETDLLCYRAEHPAPLALRQARSWQPLLDWAEREYGARLLVAGGVMHVAQGPDALAALRRAVAAHDAWGLAGLGIAVPVLGSLVLGLALAAGRLDAKQAHALAVLDETWQEEQWGPDPEAQARRTRLGEEVAMADRFMRLARQP